MTRDIETFTAFVKKYQQFSESLTDTLWQKDQKRFSALIPRFAQAKQQALQADKKEASNYNIFSILKIQRQEVVTHTPFLTNLLSPKGSHSQGRLFHDSFVKMFFELDEDRFQNYDPIQLKVKDEMYGGDFGRMDIFVENRSNKNRYGWVIENKIGAEDQPNQLVNYYKFMIEDRGHSPENVRLFYLTIHGKDPTAQSIDPQLLAQLQQSFIIRNLDYKKDIVSWLEFTLDKIQAPNVEHTILQYIKTIKTYCR